ncbi:MAG: 50S ribosomal protein L29 [Mariprofundaceae bacterium]
MKAADLRDISDADLKSQMHDLAAEGMKLRFQKATMQLVKTARVSQVRSEIARIKTVLAERGC